MKTQNIPIPRRPYKNQKEKDLELCKAYTLGTLDERKKWEEVKKENALLKYREKKFESFCFCKGDPIWRQFCAECQEWFDEELKRRIDILKSKSKKKIIEGSLEGILESIHDIGFNKLSPTSQTSPKGDFSKEKEHNISLKESVSQ